MLNSLSPLPATQNRKRRRRDKDGYRNVFQNNRVNFDAEIENIIQKYSQQNVDKRIVDLLTKRFVPCDDEESTENTTKPPSCEPAFCPETQPVSTTSDPPRLRVSKPAVGACQGSKATLVKFPVSFRSRHRTALRMQKRKHLVTLARSIRKRQAATPGWLPITQDEELRHAGKDELIAASIDQTMLSPICFGKAISSLCLGNTMPSPKYNDQTLPSPKYSDQTLPSSKCSGQNVHSPKYSDLTVRLTKYSGQSRPLPESIGHPTESSVCNNQTVIPPVCIDEPLPLFQHSQNNEVALNSDLCGTTTTWHSTPRPLRKCRRPQSDSTISEHFPKSDEVSSGLSRTEQSPEDDKKPPCNRVACIDNDVQMLPGGDSDEEFLLLSDCEGLSRPEQSPVEKKKPPCNQVACIDNDMPRGPQNMSGDDSDDEFLLLSDCEDLFDGSGIPPRPCTGPKAPRGRRKSWSNAKKSLVASWDHRPSTSKLDLPEEMFDVVIVDSFHSRWKRNATALTTRSEQMNANRSTVIPDSDLAVKLPSCSPISNCSSASDSPCSLIQQSASASFSDCCSVLLHYDARASTQVMRVLGSSGELSIFS